MRFLITLFTIIIFLFIGCGKTGPAEKTGAEISAVHPTVSWILACRVPGEGFGCFPGDSSFTTRTGMALEALSVLSALDQIEDREKLIAWIQSRQSDDGGFYEKANFFGQGNTMPWGTISALEPTYWALKALNILGAKSLRPEAAAEFISARQLESGAFHSYEYSYKAAEAALYSTFWAVGALRELGYPVPDSAKVVEWVKSQRETKARRGGYSLSQDGFFFSTTQGTYYGVVTLSLLGVQPDKPQEIKKFLLSSRGQEADGGFELGHGDNWNNHSNNSRTKDTFAAVSALQILGLPLSDTDTSRAAKPASDCALWIASIQNPDGGFARFGVTEQTPLPTPSEMSATSQAVKTCVLLGKPVPRPDNPVPPVENITIPAMKHRHPSINFNDPVEIWAYRRIAWPIYSHFLEKTGSRIKAAGMLSRWVREATGPENQASDRHVEGRKALFHGWGQCGTMSLLLQSMAASVDLPARGAYVFADANCEIQLEQENWNGPHWVCYIPFTNEWIDSEVTTPDGTNNGWSALDLAIEFADRVKNYNYISQTLLGDHRYRRVWIENLDYINGKWGEDAKIDTSMTYSGEAVNLLYPAGSW